MDGADDPDVSTTGRSHRSAGAATPDREGAAPAAGDGEGEPRGSLAAKIDRLFRTTHPPGNPGEYTYEQVAGTIAERGGPTISASYLYLLRRGLRDNPTKRHLEALAGFFGVPVSYFVDAHDPAEEARLGLLSSLRDPRVHELAVTAAGLPEDRLDVVSRLVALAAGPDARGGGRRRTAAGDDPAAGRREPGGSPDRDRDRAVRLDLAYARLALQNGEADDALRRLTAVTAVPGGPDRHLRDEAEWLTAHAHEALGRPDRALTVLDRLLDACLAGTCELPLDQVADEVCRLDRDGGDLLAAAEAGRRALTGLEDRGLTGTAEHLRLAVTLLELYLDLGQPLHARALAHRVAELAGGLTDPQQQARTYLAATRAAQSQDRLEEALELSGRAAAVVPGDDTQVARLRLAAAACLLRGGPDDVRIGVSAVESARGVLGDDGSPLDRGRWAVQRAVADLVTGQPVAAEVSARRALAHLSGAPGPVTVQAHLLLGDALRAQGRHAHADAATDQAARVLSGLSGERHRRWAAAAWRAVGDRRLQRGHGEPAAEAYRRALDLSGLLSAHPVPVPPATPVRTVPDPPTPHQGTPHQGTPHPPAPHQVAAKHREVRRAPSQHPEPHLPGPVSPESILLDDVAPEPSRG